MPEIATYKCSNYQCSLTLRLSKNFPVKRDGVLLRIRNESFCNRCKKVVEYNMSEACSTCEADVETEQLGATCPRCNQGVFTMPQLSIFK